MSMYDDVDEYIGARRVTGLAASHDFSRAVIVVAALDDSRTEYRTSLWEIDVDGGSPARRLTHGEWGESAPVFTPAGDLLFSRRSSKDDPARLWILPASGGEARMIETRSAGLSEIRSARSGHGLVGFSPVFGSSSTDEDDDALRTERKANKVDAILHTGVPVRFWDHDLGPATPHLFAGSTDGTKVFRDLTSDAAGALHEAAFDISADGAFVVSTWAVPGALATVRTVLVRIDTATGERSTIVDDVDADLGAPAISPDGASVVFVRESLSTPEDAPRMTLQRYDFGTASVVDVAPGWDRWPIDPVWLPDGSGVLVTADDDGRSPIFVVREGAEPRRLTNTNDAYTHVHVSSDGTRVLALAASYLAAPHPVSIDLSDGTVVDLDTSIDRSPLPGTLTEIDTVVGDGARVRGWLALPEGASNEEPAPLLLWVHGGPLSSWNTWSWRWNPWLMVARGYAVLLPDPALSTGYGQEFVQRGWGAWGKAPFTDLMALTDVAAALPHIDDTRTAAMGGSFGGYMANWIAGHTDRFDAIVTHASLWALDQFGPTTDAPYYWAREMSPEMAVENSPHLFVADIATPMLVIHGDKDYRVPIGEGLRLWYELLSESGLPADDEGNTDHRFLYFPAENHWILSPQHAKVWYEVVLAFLAQHVLGERVSMPRILGH
ncbi:S9 family peptidase [Rhodococcus sp. 06-470-2]|uniref:alpha/beta fold hydrolase n=1 Tax=unclassified Rhodococcus (in: high G+C Gram-positive bacteria) TaxID=192944 RepID=UPI000B9A5C20|nr:MULTISPECIES: alpha/beta fold hydrolase [unclassified Rhodococcus (in: high G+C Gram-positive bacteria)]OZC70172.1 S9 family peptidase [Rhodococcus sp. 06-470-2]OZE59795.1 S9 family peptidase [Rhodococcus sp. 05-2221-1B]